MLPEHLVPAHYHLSQTSTNTFPTENSENLTQGKRTLSDYEADILISATATGQARNMLFEECDLFILWKRNKMKDVEDNNVYLALDDHKSDEFVLKQNLAILIANKNATLESVAQEMVSIPAALVRMKWQNRREIYALQAKEEIYGAAIEAIIAQQPELRDKIMARLESTYQHILARETATLRLTRKLSEGSYEPTRITTVALDENR